MQEKTFKRIAVIYAMDRERGYLENILTDVRVEKGTDQTFFKSFERGSLEGKAQVAMCQCGIGKINASITTFLMIQQFKPDIVINTGCAGGNVIKGIKPHNIVITSKAHFYDESDVGGESEFGKNLYYNCYPFAERIKKFSPTVSEKIKIGPTASGDRFIETLKDVASISGDILSNDFPIAFDMEFSGVSRICSAYSVPSLNTRIISDVPTGPDKDNHLKMYEDFWASKDNLYEKFLNELLHALI